MFKDKFDVVEFIDFNGNVWKLINMLEGWGNFTCYYECDLYNTKAMLGYDKSYFDREKFIIELHNITKNISIAAKDPETQAFLKQYGKENRAKEIKIEDDLDLPF